MTEGGAALGGALVAPAAPLRSQTAAPPAMLGKLNINGLRLAPAFGAKLGERAKLPEGVYRQSSRRSWPSGRPTSSCICAAGEADPLPGRRGSR